MAQTNTETCQRYSEKVVSLHTVCINCWQIKSDMNNYNIYVKYYSTYNYNYHYGNSTNILKCTQNFAVTLSQTMKHVLAVHQKTPNKRV